MRCSNSKEFDLRAKIFMNDLISMNNIITALSDEASPIHTNDQW